MTLPGYHTSCKKIIQHLQLTNMAVLCILHCLGIRLGTSRSTGVCNGHRWHYHINDTAWVSDFLRVDHLAFVVYKYDSTRHITLPGCQTSCEQIIQRLQLTYSFLRNNVLENFHNELSRSNINPSCLHFMRYTYIYIYIYIYTCIFRHNLKQAELLSSIPIQRLKLQLLLYVCIRVINAVVLH